MLKSKWEEAREAWAAALDSPRPEIDWFLGEAQCLDQMNRPQERAVCLGDAVERNPSSVLRRTWVAALIETGNFDAATREIAAGLERSRRKSTWLLLRARLHETRGRTAARDADATMALEELRPLLRTATPDPWRVTEAGLALAMLGNEDAARRSIVRAKQHGAPDHWLDEIVERID
jgi:Flp pilus assembly protein TadD